MSRGEMPMAQVGRAETTMSADGGTGADVVHCHRAWPLWAPATVVVLGVWMVFAPASFGYGDTAAL